MRKGTAARLAGVRPLAGVSAQVQNHGGLQPKSLPTHLALVWFLSRVEQNMSRKPAWISGCERTCRAGILLRLGLCARSFTVRVLALPVTVRALKVPPTSLLV